MKKIISVIALSILLSGCVTINDNQLTTFNFPKNVKTASLSYEVVSFYETLNGEPTSVISADSSKNATYWIGKNLFKRWQHKKLIGVYSQNNPYADYTVKLVGTRNKETPIPLSIVSGLTLAVIPTWVTYEYDLHVTFINNKTDKSYYIPVKNSYTTIVQTALLPFIIFSGIGVSDMYNDTSAYIYNELNKQGAFDV